jgi:hypothetical protein
MESLQGGGFSRFFVLVAGGEPWLGIWQTADRKPELIFSSPIQDWTADQRGIVTVSRILDRLREQPEGQRGPMEDIESWEDVDRVLTAVREARSGVEHAHSRAGEFSYSRYSEVIKF